MPVLDDPIAPPTDNNPDRLSMQGLFRRIRQDLTALHESTKGDRTVYILNDHIESLREKLETTLADPHVREGLSSFVDTPTIPRLDSKTGRPARD